MTDEKSCRALIDGVAKKHGKLNILVNNAGINIRKAAGCNSMSPSGAA